MSTNKSKGNFYNLEELKSIPIESICRSLGLEITHKGSRIWIKLRNERTASAVIDPGKNTFYDFGSGEHGDNIALISTYFGYSRTDAIYELANMFHIDPTNPREGLKNNELTLWEYSQIGIQGDMVSKNLNFDLSQPYDKLVKKASTFSMDVNSLRNSKSDYLKKTYDSIIYDRALPYIQELKNIYFLTLWSNYEFFKNIAAPEMFDIYCSGSEVTEMQKEIVSAEKIFNQAVAGTKIKPFPDDRDYSPDTIMQDILNKRVKPELGPCTFNEIKKSAKINDSAIEYIVVDYADYMDKKVEEIKHSAFLDAQSEKVIIGCLKENKASLENIFVPDRYKRKSNTSLNNMVKGAEKRKYELNKETLNDTKKESKDI